jgi:hypothetical protein
MLRASGLPVERQRRLIGLLSRAYDARLEPIAAQFERTPEWISAFLGSIEKKMAAVAARDEKEYRDASAPELKELSRAE